MISKEMRQQVGHFVSESVLYPSTLNCHTHGYSTAVFSSVSMKRSLGM